MGLLVGPTPWWQASIVSRCPEGTYLPDGSTIICKSGGTAWIVAPSCTQVNSSWANYSDVGKIDNPPAGCSVHSDITSTQWSALYNRLISCGFNPTDWFVPCIQLLQNPGYVCRDNWDSFSICFYWASTEVSADCARRLCLGNGALGCEQKQISIRTRAFRCVTY